jgi:hypothetical protein
MAKRRRGAERAVCVTRSSKSVSQRSLPHQRRSIEERKLLREVESAPEALEKIMKRVLLVACIGLLAATTASAENPPAQSGPNNKAINSAGQNNSDAPVAGRNSFTEGQAKSKIEDAGYTNVTALKKDDNGVWRGKASKSGSANAVSVDFQGNVNTAK